MSPQNDWHEWRQHVLHQLEQQRLDHKEVRVALAAINVQIATLKARAGVWGALAGMLPAVAALIWSLL